MRGTLQALADRHELGVTIRAVRLGRVVPPAAVAPAFADAARARSDKRQTITRAEEYRDKAEADARGQAREIADRAAGRHETVVQAARGEADRFAKLLAGVKGNPEAARRRLYLETLRQILPRLARTVVVAPGEAVDLSLFTGEGAASTTPSKPNAPGPPSGSVPR
ncbi:MAG: hypothetical protein U0794_09415 [Isosphaeraceae bacterium]